MLSPFFVDETLERCPPQGGSIRLSLGTYNHQIDGQLFELGFDSEIVAEVLQDVHRINVNAGFISSQNRANLT